MRRINLLLLLFVSCLNVSYGQTGNFYPSERFSSGLINSICQDKYGYIWIATDYGLNKFDGYRFTTYLHQAGDTTTLQSNVAGCVFCDAEGRLWVGTTVGLDRYDYRTDEFIHYQLEGTKRARVTEISQRSNGQILVGTAGYGLQTLNGRQLKKVTDGYTLKELNRYFNHVVEDSQGRFWKCGFGTKFSMRDAQGTHLLDSQLGNVVGFAEHQGAMLIICQNGIYAYRNGLIVVAPIDLSAAGNGRIVFNIVFQNSVGNIYIGTRGDGLFKLENNSRTLVRVESSSRNIDLNSAKVWAISEDKLGNLWVGCQSKGVLMIPRIQPQFQAWSFAAQSVNVSSTITSVCEGDDGMIWCTVQGNGVYGFNTQGKIVAHPVAPSPTEYMFRDRTNRYWIGTDKGLYAYNPKTGLSHLEITFDCDRFNYMTDDEQGNLYISTFSRGFCKYNTKTRELRNFSFTKHDSIKGWICNDWVMAMMPDRQGRIWLATSNGVSCYDANTDNFHAMGWHQLLTGVMCYSLCENRRGQILIGTEQGLYFYEQGMKDAEPFKNGEGLRNKIICSVVEANNGDLWCATSMGIWQYDANKKKFIGHVNGNGLSAREYISCVGIHVKTDKIYFANNDGLVVFDPSQVTGSHTQLPDLCLTGFLIAGKPVNTRTLSDGTPVAGGATIETDRYYISYLDNTLSLEFSLLDYNNPSNIIFEYQINGGEWIQNPEGQNSIQLSHLQPGTYDVTVRAQALGVYSSSKIITVVVTPPWYRTTLAYVLYILFIIGVLLLLAWIWRRKARMQLDEDKMKFLINTTHDIRSPLTLIMGPLAKLRHIVNDETGRSYLETIDRNAQRLMLLVNQILDERRIDKNQMQLHCRETNMVDFISNICKLYQYNASQREITFTFEHDKDHLLTWIDRINFDKVINNLLANAFKYTFDGGEVKVALCERENDIEIRIVDNGMGVKEDDLKHLFDRFYQGRNADSLGIQGTGIGLNLSRSIVLMHGGGIKAENRRDGHGACFVVTLPKGNKHLKPEQIVTDSPAREVLSTGNSTKAFRQYSILIVDDDPEIADYIIGELGNKYKFKHSPNGVEALKTLLTGQFDLVISDVMMPEMDGITLLKKIKDNPNISQLPVIMLTSKAEVEHKLEGLKSGADAYIAKPFSMEELHIQIDNLIDNVRRLRGKFSGAAQQEERVENIEVKGNNDALMERIMRSVNANMKNPDFNVDTLASDVGISRAQLHRKMKEITGISSGKFLRNLRMEQAARLLREGKVNITQVADSVGYNDQAHFSTAFKSHFGMTPTEYLEKHKSE